MCDRIHKLVHNFQQNLTLTLCLGGLYYLASRFSRFYTYFEGPAYSLWPATGIGIAAVLLFGIRRSLPGLILGTLLIANNNSSNYITITGFSFLYRPLEAVLGGGILNILAKGRFRFKTTKDIIYFIIFAVILGPLVSTGIGALCYYLIGNLPKENLGYWWMSFFIGNALGALVITPFMVSVFTSWRKLIRIHPLRILEVAVLILSVLFITPWALTNGKSFLIYPLISWAALRFTFLGVSASVLGISTFAMYTGKVLFNGAEYDNMWTQSFIATITVCSYFLATLRETEKVVVAQQKESERHLQNKRIAEEALALLHQSISNSPVGFALVDRDFKYIEINEMLAKFNGCSVDEHKGRSIRELSSFGIHFEEIVAFVFETGNSLMSVPIRLRGQGGKKEAFGLISYYPVRQPGGSSIFGVAISFEDLTEQNRVECMLREQQTRLEFAQEAGRMGVYSWNYYTDEVQWTPQLEGIYGLGKGEFDGKFSTFLNFIHPDDVEMVKHSASTSMREGVDVGVQFRILRTNGEIRWVLARGGLLRDENGKHVGFTGINVDITDQKNIEERLRKAEGELLEAIAARDEFFAVVSHELKTPLTSLKLQVQLHQRALDKNDPLALQREKVSQLLSKNYLQLERLNRLVEDMLDVSRIRTGKLSLRLDLCEISQIIKDILARTREQFIASGSGEPDVQIQDLAFGHWDHMRIEQVICNVINNAIRYGLGRPVSISVGKSEGQVRISVSDQGIGITDDDQKRIFQRFERGGYSKEKTGLGLGLFICEQIVTAHGGRIWVESQWQRGSTFYIDLPTVADEVMV